MRNIILAIQFELNFVEYNIILLSKFLIQHIHNMANEGDPEERIVSCIRGYHVYSTVLLEARIGDVLQCNREVKLIIYGINYYAASIVNGTDIVGHLPKMISTLCSLFI